VSGRALAGRSVVVTRAREQAGAMIERLGSLGASVVELPVIATATAADAGAALDAAARRLKEGRYGWVALTSANAAERLLAALGPDAGDAPASWAALGEGTASALRGTGIRPAVVADVATSEGLVAAFPVAPRPETDDDAPARTVLFPRAERVRGALAAGLRAEGWVVDEVVAYRTVAAVPPADAVERARHADAIAFTSSSTVEHTVRVLGVAGVPATVASIGPSTSHTARDAGLEVTVEADPHTIDGLVDALARVLGGTHHDGREARDDGSPGGPR
jgi:uroporphyrinogen III methyltransferase / synthase